MDVNTALFLISIGIVVIIGVILAAFLGRCVARTCG